MIEMNYEGVVFIVAHHVVQEGEARGALVIEDIGLAHAGIDQKA